MGDEKKVLFVYQLKTAENKRLIPGVEKSTSLHENEKRFKLRNQYAACGCSARLNSLHCRETELVAKKEKKTS